ncbi:MAG: hypothetical protein Q9195_001477 [Heterodermia aff. obscurata]
MDFSKQVGNGFLYRWEKEQYYQRHQNIAFLVKEIVELDSVVTSYPRPLPRRSRWSSTKSESDVLDDDEEEDIEDFVGSDEEWTVSSITELTEFDGSGHCEDPKSETRRERKAARRAARNKARFAGLTKGEIERVEQALHPNGDIIGESSDPKDPLNDSTIKDNIAFNSSTFRYASLRTGVHQKKMLKSNISSKTINRERMQSQNAEISMFIQKLGIVNTNANAGPKNRRVLLARLREAIRNDLECVANEAQQRMMRKAGYWRYANRRTYNLMIQKNLIWDWETGAKLEVLDEEPEDDALNESNDPPTEVYSSQSEHSDEATAGLKGIASIKETIPTNSSTAEKSLEGLKYQNTSPEPIVHKLETQSPYSGKADRRHLQVPVLLVSSNEGKKLQAPVEAKAKIKEDPGCEKAEMKASEDLNGAAAEEEEEEIVPLSPLQAKVTRKSTSRSENKALADRNNPYSALEGYVEEDWKKPKASQVDISPVSTSRRSSVRSAVRPPATIRPSPLPNVVATSSRVPDLSALPELPSTKVVKPEAKAPHPPARLNAQEAANFRTQLVTRSRLSTSARGGHSGGAGRGGGHAGSSNYAAVLRRKPDEN